MTDTELCPTDVERFKRLLLDMAQQRSVDTVLKLIVDQLKVNCASIPRDLSQRRIET